MSLADRISHAPDAATALADWSREQIVSAENAFDARRAIARRLGAQVDGGTVTFGFWTPELLDRRVPEQVRGNHRLPPTGVRKKAATGKN